MITWREAQAIVRDLDPNIEWSLPPRVTCLRCGLIFEPTETVGIRYNPNFGVFFFYCEEHDHASTD